MSKRRTRKDKEKAQHQFSISWKPGSESEVTGSLVNRQFKNTNKPKNLGITTVKKADNLAKEHAYEPIKKDVVKSLFLASLILALETVLYFIWK